MNKNRIKNYVLQIPVYKALNISEAVEQTHLNEIDFLEVIKIGEKK